MNNITEKSTAWVARELVTLASNHEATMSKSPTPIEFVVVCNGTTTYAIGPS